MPKPKKITKHRKLHKTRRLIIEYPLVIFSLLCVGTLLISWTYAAFADSASVTATVAAQPLSEAPVILSPHENQHFSSQSVNVSGVCSDGSYINLYRNGVYSGSYLCSADHTFTITTFLFDGLNKFTTSIFNPQNEQGPDSAPVSVYYDTVDTSKTPPLVLDIPDDFQYTGYFVGQTVEVKLVAGGGVAPYIFDVDWGDNDPRYIRDQPGPFSLSHTYSRVGEYKGSHIIKIATTDAMGHKTFLQLFVIINAKTDGTAAATGKSSKTPTNTASILSAHKNWLWLAWPSYAIISLMGLSYMLGQREEFLVLRRRGKLKRS